MFIVIISLTWMRSKKFIVLYCYRIPEKTKINSQWKHHKGHVHLTDTVLLTEPVHLNYSVHLTDSEHLTDTVRLIYLTDFLHLIELSI